MGSVEMKTDQQGPLLVPKNAGTHHLIIWGWQANQRTQKEMHTFQSI
jgi:hypothetical protein